MDENGKGVRESTLQVLPEPGESVWLKLGDVKGAIEAPTKRGLECCHGWPDGGQGAANGHFTIL